MSDVRRCVDKSADCPPIACLVLVKVNGAEQLLRSGYPHGSVISRYQVHMLRALMPILHSESTSAQPGIYMTIMAASKSLPTPHRM